MSKKSIKASKLTPYQRFSLYFYKHAKTSLIIWVVVLVLGSLSYTTFMRREGFPPVEISIATAQVIYPGQTAATVDSAIIVPFSKAVAEVESLNNLQTYSTPNFAQLVFEFDEGTAPADGVKAVEAATNNFMLPEGASITYRPVNAAKLINRYDALLAVYSETDVPIEQLVARAEKVAEDMRAYGLRDGYEVEVVDQFAGTQQRTADRFGLSENGKVSVFTSVTVGVIKPAGDDVFKLEEKLDGFLAQSSYQDIKVATSASFGPQIEDQIESLQGNLFEGLLIVIVVSLLLINLRAGIVTGLSMVTVLVLTLLVLWAMGNSLNTITLFALVLCLGLIVDDTTIVIEAIDSEVAAGASKPSAIRKAVKKVALASTAGTLTTALGFAPMLFVGGILGKFIRVLPITIITSLLLSLLVSLSLVPFLSRWLAGGSQKSYASRALHWLIARPLAALVLVTKQGRLARVALSLVALSIGVVFAAATGWYATHSTFDIFPSTKDTNDLSVTVRVKQPTTLEYAQSQLKLVEDQVDQAAGEWIEQVAYYGQIGSDQATMAITLTPYAEREPKAPQIIDTIKAKVDGISSVSVSVGQIDAGPPKDELPFRVQIFSEDEKLSVAAATEIRDILNQTSLTRPDGSTAKVQNAQVADIGTIHRVDGKQVTSVLAGFDASDTSALVTLAQTELEKTVDGQWLTERKLSADSVTYDFGNEQDNQESFKTMLIAMPILLLVMFLMLAVQFKSVLQPLLIFMAVPFSLLGVFAGLYYTNNALSFFVMIGLFALIGISVNNTILLTDYANQFRREGRGPIEAIHGALQERFRALMTTSITAVAALIPLALTDPFWEAICVTLIFGLLSSTIFVLLLFPYYYLWVEWLRAQIARLIKRIRPRGK